jgi:hypothetical protein
MLLADILAARGLRGFRVPANPFICFDDPPADQPGGGNNNRPPAADAELQPTPARAPGQSDTERAQQLEGILAEVRAEAAVRRVGKREAESRAAALQNELATLRADADRREQTARTEGETRANKIKQRAVDAELKAAAVAAGLRDPDLLLLIDRAGVAIDDDGNVTGVEAAVTAFKTKKPEYFQAAAPARAGETVAVRTSGSPAPPQPAPGATPPAGADVRTLPKDRAGKAAYGDAKKAALASLR